MPHHITQRAISGQRVFLSEADYHRYVSLLFDQSEKFALSVEGYCLMPNHVHIIASPDRTDSLARAIGRTNLIYAQYFNRLHDRNGHLWQNRFYSCPMDEAHFCAAMRYVEMNPVSAGIVDKPRQFRWSSAAVHCGDTTGDPRLSLERWRESFNPDEWRELLSSALDDEVVSEIAHATMVGRPLGSDAFLSQIGSTFGSALRPRPVGRPRKASVRPQQPHLKDYPHLKRLAAFARPRYAGKDAAHDFRHIERIMRLVAPLSDGVEPPGRPHMLYFLACFHGLTSDLREDTAFRERTGALLRELGWKPGEIDEALVAVHRHVHTPKTSEEMVVHDANCAETLGALGIAKAFTTGGARRQSYRETLEILEERVLPNATFFTPGGRRLAARAGSFTRDFVKRLHRELSPPDQSAL
ncbi:MAG: transposase [Planctomycetota bacterium]